MVKLEYLELDKIVVEGGLRKTPMEEKSLEELAASIARHGVLQPILVEPAGEGRYRLLIGERRLKAAEKAGLTKVPAHILDESLKPEESLEVRLVENLHREGLDPLDEAEAYAALREMGLTVSAIARRVGKSRPYVANSMRLLKLHPSVRRDIRRRTLSPGQAQPLLRLTPEQQLGLAEEVKAEGLSVKETRRKVRELLGKPLKWQLIPVRVPLETYEALKRIAPDGDVKRLLQEAVERLLQQA